MVKGRLFFIRCEGWICFTDEKTGKAKTRKIISRNKKTKTCKIRNNNKIEEAQYYV